MHEDLDITNHGRKHVRFNLEIAIRSRLRRHLRGEAARIVRRGRISTEWSEDAAGAPHRLSQPGFRARGAHQRTQYRGQRAVYANGRLSFEVSIDPGATWHCCLLYDLMDGTRHYPRAA